MTPTRGGIGGDVYIGFYEPHGSEWFHQSPLSSCINPTSLATPRAHLTVPFWTVPGWLRTHASLQRPEVLPLATTASFGRDYEHEHAELRRSRSDSKTGKHLASMSNEGLSLGDDLKSSTHGTGCHRVPAVGVYRNSCVWC